MNSPAYTDGWNAQRVVRYLLADPKFVAWKSLNGDPPQWITADGSVFGVMDDDEARWLATWKFVADRIEVSRMQLLDQYSNQTINDKSEQGGSCDAEEAV